MAQWKVIALTCGPSASCDALSRELEARKSKGLIDRDTLLLVIDDPVRGIGSGGATLNALLVITEHLASQAGYTVVNSDVLDKAHILILHVGRHYMYNSTGRAFVNIPSSSSRDRDSSENVGLMTTLDHLINTMTTQVATGAPPGVWVCSTDMVLSIPSSFGIDWSRDSNEADVIALSVHGDVVTAQEHGVYVADSQGLVTDILYRASASELQKHTNSQDHVNMVVGIVYFNKRATEKLLSFHTVSPLNRCTYVGIDSGAQPIQVSLFFDLLYAMCHNESASKAQHRYAVTVKMPAEQYQNKWRLLHKILSDLRVKTVTVEDGKFHYLFNNRESLEGAMKSLTNTTDHSQLITVNSIVVEKITDNLTKAHISNCRLTESVGLCDNVLLSGVDCKLHQPGDIIIKPDMVYQHMRVSVSDGQHDVIVPVVFGARDSFKVAARVGTFCNEPWEKFMSKSGCVETDLWSPNCPEDERTLGTARLYPVMYLGEAGYRDSLCWMQPGVDVKQSTIDRWRGSWRLSLVDLLEHVDLVAEFAWRRELFAEISQAKVKDTLTMCKEFSLISLYKNISTEQPEHCHQILQVLDQVAAETHSPGIAARALANIADVLGCMAGNQGGLRSGPSANAAWKHAYDLLEGGMIGEGVVQLAAVRSRWLTTGDHIVRAARHYEGAAQILIRRAVMSARKYISLTSSQSLPDINRWVIGESPARADIAGGWSDTPPISYEHGGAVTNAAILVDGKKPIGCKARRITAPHLELVMNSGTDVTKITISDIDGLRDYCQPQSPGALLKAAFVCANIVHLDCGFSLEHQLSTQYGGGFELHTWSNLPHGSGLGTSSILAGVVMAVLWKTSGENYTMSSLLHAVLHLEQMMTTGGGWQDQVGGLLPGIKIGMSEAKLPLYVSYRQIELSQQTLQQFNSRFLLIYTGKTRLARNLLQNVVRNWYARDPKIVQTEDDLVKIAYECEEAFKQCDLVRVGELWTTYWQLKKQMATGCEPASVSLMINILKPHVLSCCMAGAGGGGFLYVLTKEPDQRLLVKGLLAKLELTEEYSIHEASVCTEGLTITQTDADEL